MVVTMCYPGPTKAELNDVQTITVRTANSFSWNRCSACKTTLSAGAQYVFALGRDTERAGWVLCIPCAQPMPAYQRHLAEQVAAKLRGEGL